MERKPPPGAAFRSQIGVRHADTVGRKLPTTKTPTAGDSALISDIVRRLADLYRPERIYLFGSAARDDAGPDSDHDFMVVVSGDTPRETRENAPIEVLVWTRREFDKHQFTVDGQ